MIIWVISSKVTLASDIDDQFRHANVEYFVKFEPGNYQQTSSSELDELAQQLYILNGDPLISLIGKSQSRSSLATQQLALNRAKIIKQLLVKRGIRASQIILSADYENFKTEGTLLNGVLAISKADVTTSKMIKIGFVIFPPSQYKQTAPENIDKIVNQLKSQPKSVQFNLIGVSQSATSLATKKLATQRAQKVADEFIIRGIAPERIKIDAEITNFVKDYHLTHGVHIYAEAGDIKNETAKIISTEKLNTSTSTSASSSSSIPIETQPKDKQQALNDVIKRLNQSIASDTNADNKTQKVSQPENANKLKKITKTDTNIDPCKQLIIKKGSLKKNIEREIADCGYLMGEWKFGTDVELIDWLIPIPYRLEIDNGIFGILKVIEKNYQIRAHVHQLDKSIDFLASIKREKGQ
ncbi:MAG: hypothetical protein P8I13_06885 [Porticoccaceae bacterium]|nr:hypothetical protein [Porticoccaceae bacterium]